ncbi:MAG: hypothetical protein IT556_07360 [Acetobacteraceae bacterium]|nr:hypothetical protein [Acetobacteraceae bacterium]
MAEHIQINDVSPRIQYVADGATADFGFPFAIFAASDLQVFIDGAQQGSGYTASGAGQSGGGLCRFAAAPPAGAVVTLRRRLPIRRTSDFQENGVLRARVLNDELDYQTAAIQQLADDSGRALHFDAADPVPSGALPPRAARAGRLLGFGSDGAPALFSPAGGIGSAENVLYTPSLGAGAGTVAAKLAETLSVRDFGAAGDGATDDTQAIQAAFDAATARGASVLIPDGSYRTTQPVTLGVGAFGLHMRGEILAAGQGGALRIGQPGSQRLWGTRYTGLRVRRLTQSDWSSEAEIGIQIFNAYASEIGLEHAEGFTIGAQAFGDANGFVYCRVTLGRFYNNRIGLDLRSGQGGWNNQNTFIGGTFQLQSTLHPGLDRCGIRFSRTATGYDNPNNNLFLNPSFELRGVQDWWPSTAYAVGTRIRGAGGRIYVAVQAGTSGAGAPSGTGSAIADGSVRWDYAQAAFDSVPVLMEAAGRANMLIGARNEGSGRIIAREFGDALGNQYDFAYVGGQGAAGNAIGGHYIDYRGNLAGSVLHLANGIDRFAAADQPLKLIWQVADVRSAANPYDATRIFVQGCSLVATSPAPERRLNTFRQLNNLELRPGALRVGVSSRGVGTCVDTRAARRFLFSYALDGQAQAGRMLVRCFDADDRLITTGQPVRASRALTFNAGLGGFFSGSESFAPLYFELDPEVATIWVGITGSAAGPADITALRLFCVEGHAPRVFPGHAEDDPGPVAIAVAAPSIGTHDLGALVRNVAATGPSHWECTAGGTFGTLAGVAGTTITGTANLFLASAGGLASGEYVAVAGAVAAASVAAIQRYDAAAVTAWAASTAYTAGTVVARGGNVYVCVTAGTSGSTGPSGTGNGIADGGCTWNSITARATLSANATATVSGAAVAYVAPGFAARART